MSTPPSITIETGDPSLFFGYPLLIDQYATTTFDSDTGLHNFTFDVEYGLQYQVEITVDGNTLDPELELERSDGSVLGGGSTEDGATLRYSFIADETDTWSMRIGDVGLDDFYTQTYTVRVIGTDWISDDPFTTTAAFNSGELITDGAIFISDTDYLGDVDVIEMKLEAGVKYGFFLAGYNSAYDPRMTIYDTDGETKLKQKHVYNDITSYNYTPDDTGTYYFEARDNAGNDMGTYMAGVYSQGNDTIEGSSDDDVLISGGGSDWVVSFGGSDTVYGGAGNDTVNGGGGADSLAGGGGDDSLIGGNQTDTLSGAGGNDTLNGNGGQDTLFGGAGNDTLNGGAKNDDIFGGGANDALNGNKGADELDGGSGNDSLSGNGGQDTLNGAGGDDELSGNAGQDVFLFMAGWGDDTILDYEPRDTILFAGILGLNSVDDLTITQDGDDMVLEYGFDSVRVRDAAGILDPDDIDILF